MKQNEIEYNSKKNKIKKNKNNFGIITNEMKENGLKYEKKNKEFLFHKLAKYFNKLKNYFK